jgi:hypothetical protein
VNKVPHAIDWVKRRKIERLEGGPRDQDRNNHLRFLIARLEIEKVSRSMNKYFLKRQGREQFPSGAQNAATHMFLIGLADEAFWRRSRGHRSRF